MKNLITIIVSLAIGFIITYFAMVIPAHQDREELAGLLDSTIHEFTVWVDDAGREIATQRQVIASLENAVAAGLVTNEELKELNIRRAQQIVRLEAEIKRMLETDYTVPPIIIKDSLDFEYIRIPQQFSFEDDWTEIFGTIHAQGVTIDDLTVFTETNIFTGYRRTGFFKPLEPVVTIRHDNPYMQTQAMENITFTQKPPFYKRPNWHRMEGAAVLYGILKLSNLIL